MPHKGAVAKARCRSSMEISSGGAEKAEQEANWAHVNRKPGGQTEAMRQATCERRWFEGAQMLVA